MNTPALDYISIQGFKSIASVKKLPLRPINLLIGANGCGKSNFIGLFAFLHEIREGRLQKYVRSAGGAEQLLHFGSKVTDQITVHISFDGEVNQYRLTLDSTSEDTLVPGEERVFFWDNKINYNSPYDEYLSPRNRGLEAGISNTNVSGTAEFVRDGLARWRLYHVHDTSANSPMRKSAQVDDNELLRPDGSNLSAFLYRLQQRNPRTYRFICRTIQQVAPFFDDFRLRPDPLNEEVIKLAWRHRESDQYFGVSSLSDGTLRFIALTTLFLQPKELRPSVILVDEPELGLHPHAITLLASLVKQAAVDTQVILSTQSSLLLDHFDPEDVLVAEREGGATQLRRLSPNELEGWLDDYSLGQLWEKNELGGRPKPE